ncbi:MAG: hypothetical protein ISR83_08820 [Candidatus Marinimicrobia bacterium]|nr:hypothetical protein [Candidatus Neomarinimicrobiota bacterium]
MKQILYSILLILGCATAFGQSSNPDMEKFGFLYVHTDSLGAPLYIDGVFIGNDPLDGVIPVLPGFHEVGYLPPEISNKFVKGNLSEAVKRVYVTPNDTLDVFLYYDHYANQAESFHKEFKIQSYTGIGLFFIVIMLIFNAI